eukprot:6066592-Prymnesium_polylepis.1
MAQLTSPSTTESAAESLPWNGPRTVSFGSGNIPRGLDGCFQVRWETSAAAVLEILLQPSHAYTGAGTGTGCFFSDGSTAASTASCYCICSKGTASPSACRAAICRSDAFGMKNLEMPFMPVTFCCLAADGGGRK